MQKKGIFLAVLSVLFSFAAYVVADTGFKNAIRIEVGNVNETRKISLATGASTVIAVSSPTRPSLTCFNNNAFEVYIGSNCAGSTLLQMGFPILSSATFAVGSSTGSLYGISGGASAADIRCFEGLTK